MKSRLTLVLACIILLSSFIGCKDIAGTLKARFNKATQGATATSAGNFGNTSEEQAMINAVTEKYGDLREQGSPRILELMLCSSVVNYIPADRVSQYSSNTPKFYAWFIYDNFNEDTISVEWLYLDDNYSIGTSKSKTGKDFGRGSFTLEAPDEGWPLGKYRVKVSGKGVTQTVDFGVIAGATQSVAILLPDGSVDLEGTSSGSAAADSETDMDTESDAPAASDTGSGSGSSTSAGGDSSSATSTSWNAGTTSTSSSSSSSAGPGSASYFAGSLGGTWSVNFNNYKGKMEFWLENGKWAGRLYLDAHGKWETLKNISCNTRTGAVSFYRDAGNQTYTGIILDRNMSGTFTSSGTSGYKWTATLSSFTTTATSSSSSSATSSSSSSSSAVSSSSSGQGVWHKKSYRYEPWSGDRKESSSYLAGTTSVLIDYTEAGGGRLSGFTVSTKRMNEDHKIIGAGTANALTSTTKTVIPDPPEYIKPGEKPSLTVSHKVISTTSWGASKLNVNFAACGTSGCPFLRPDGSQIGLNYDGKVILNNPVLKGVKGQTRELVYSIYAYKFIFTYEWLE